MKYSKRLHNRLLKILRLVKGFHYLFSSIYIYIYINIYIYIYVYAYLRITFKTT